MARMMKCKKWSFEIVSYYDVVFPGCRDAPWVFYCELTYETAPMVWFHFCFAKLPKLDSGVWVLMSITDGPLRLYATLQV